MTGFSPPLLKRAKSLGAALEMTKVRSYKLSPSPKSHHN